MHALQNKMLVRQHTSSVSKRDLLATFLRGHDHSKPVIILRCTLLISYTPAPRHTLLVIIHALRVARQTLLQYPEDAITSPKPRNSYSTSSILGPPYKLSDEDVGSYPGLEYEQLSYLQYQMPPITSWGKVFLASYATLPRLCQ